MRNTTTWANTDIHLGVGTRYFEPLLMLMWFLDAWNNHTQVFAHHTCMRSIGICKPGFRTPKGWFSFHACWPASNTISKQKPCGTWNRPAVALEQMKSPKEDWLWKNVLYIYIYSLGRRKFLVIVRPLTGCLDVVQGCLVSRRGCTTLKNIFPSKCGYESIWTSRIVNFSQIQSFYLYKWLGLTRSVRFSERLYVCMLPVPCSVSRVVRIPVILPPRGTHLAKSMKHQRPHSAKDPGKVTQCKRPLYIFTTIREWGRESLSHLFPERNITWQTQPQPGN